MTNKDTIIRDNVDDKYLILSNEVAQDSNLPYDALGVLVYLLSKPRDWKTTVHDLCQRGNGKSKIYRILGVLEQVGYMKKPTKHRNKDTNQWEWTPRIVANSPKFITPCTRFEDTGNEDTQNGEIKEQRTDEKEQITKKDIAATSSGADTSICNVCNKRKVAAILDGIPICDFCGGILNWGQCIDINEMGLDWARKEVVRIQADPQAPSATSHVQLGDVIRSCYGCDNDMFVGERMYWSDDAPLEIYCSTCDSYDGNIDWNVATLTADYTAPPSIDIEWNEPHTCTHQSCSGNHECECAKSGNPPCESGDNCSGDCDCDGSGKCGDLLQNKQQLTAEQAKMLEYVKVAYSTGGASFTNEEDIVSLVGLGYVKSYPNKKARFNRARWELTDTGRAALKRWQQAQQSDGTIDGQLQCARCRYWFDVDKLTEHDSEMLCNQQCYSIIVDQEYSDEQNRAEKHEADMRALDDERKRSEPEQSTECCEPQQTADDEPIVTITVDDDIAPETLEAIGGMVEAAHKAIKNGTLPPPPKKAKKVRTPKQQRQDDIISACCDAMGIVMEDITNWGKWYKAAKMLIDANTTLDEIPGLYRHTRNIQVKQGWEFKDAMPMATRLAAYRAERRQVKQAQEQAPTDEPQPLSADDVVTYEDLS